MNIFEEFAIDSLAPASRAVLLRAFAAHGKGEDLGVAAKPDGTPASEADREAERVMRQLIAERFPDHGIVGEEYGAENAEAEYVWVLDPLDGTREFLAKAEGWGTLIALLRHGKPIVGIIDDPSQRRIRQAVSAAPAKKSAALKDASVCCTNSSAMFTGSNWQDGAQRLLSASGTVMAGMNCLGFAAVAEGTADLAVEADLKLHDVAALLPVLWQAGAVCRMLDGRDYKNHVFNPGRPDKAYSLLTGRNLGLVDEAMGFFTSTERQALHG